MYRPQLVPCSCFILSWFLVHVLSSVGSQFMFPSSCFVLSWFPVHASSSVGSQFMLRPQLVPSSCFILSWFPVHVSSSVGSQFMFRPQLVPSSCFDLISTGGDRSGRAVLVIGFCRVGWIIPNLYFTTISPLDPLPIQPLLLLEFVWPADAETTP